jgi:beta-galactosidase
VTDQTTTTFGIRTIHFDAKTGFTLNGKTVLLKGGNLHHDNGFWVRQPSTVPKSGVWN